MTTVPASAPGAVEDAEALWDSPDVRPASPEARWAAHHLVGGQIRDAWVMLSQRPDLADELVAALIRTGPGARARADLAEVACAPRTPGPVAAVAFEALADADTAGTAARVVEQIALDHRRIGLTLFRALRRWVNADEQGRAALGALLELRVDPDAGLAGLGRCEGLPLTWWVVVARAAVAAGGPTADAALDLLPLRVARRTLPVAVLDGYLARRLGDDRRARDLYARLCGQRAGPGRDLDPLGALTAQAAAAIAPRPPGRVRT